MEEVHQGSCLVMQPFALSPVVAMHVPAAHGPPRPRIYAAPRDGRRPAGGQPMAWE
ncbi:MAG: hypothetical protein AVDCRST_MAG76-764 [uncultured Acidimicrobiales bacterium]|uniref:Uncharacterized protein n=1 Tax=uncultured Acidimicrobiales bacterium TaxID=310071 RepID=A0A6J4HEK7_9ACTN|nr:MAG: hypothetical protein AVDCRST_MAG76-764 [uncultured Acidimicrobiales bacterium]